MNGKDKILSRISSDCDERIRAIEAETERDCSEIISAAGVKAKKAAEIECRAQLDVKRIKESCKSRAELETRSLLLKKRREEIDVTVDGVLKYMTGLGDGEYFELIYALAKTLGGGSGEVLFNKKDLSRLPSDFEQRLKELGVNASVSERSADISGGFILKTGDVEENMSFSAVIADKRDALEDLINRELFIG